MSIPDCSKACTGPSALLLPSSLPFRNITFLPLVRNQMLIVNQSTARKRAGEEIFAKRLVIFSLRSIKVAVSIKKKKKKKRVSNEIKITS